MAIKDRHIATDANFPVETISLRHGAQVPASQTGILVGFWRVPADGYITSAHFNCRALAGTVTVDIFKNAATILTGAVTPVADTMTAGTLVTSPTSVAAGDSIKLVATTASASTLDDGHVIFNYRPKLRNE